MRKLIAKGERPAVPENSPWEELIGRCWAQDPQKRPSAEQALELLPYLYLKDLLEKEVESLREQLKQKDREINKLRASPIPAAGQPMLYPDIAFGAAKWGKYFGVDIGAEPPLPRDMDKILESPCPFWRGKRVEETHLLVLIPGSIGDQLFTLRTFGELIKLRFPEICEGLATGFRSDGGRS